MATPSNRKPESKSADKSSGGKKSTRRAVAPGSKEKAVTTAKKATARSVPVAGNAKAGTTTRSQPASASRSAPRVEAKKTAAEATAPANADASSRKSAASLPVLVKSTARAIATARSGAAKRRPPSYIPRSHFLDDGFQGGPLELPRQPRPAAHAPTRKAPKPRAPKPKAISHEQAVANLKALLESRKRKDRAGAASASPVKAP